VTDPAGPTRTAEAAVALLELFIVAVVAALVITLASVPPEVQLIASAAVVPILAASFVLLYYCRKGRAWGFGGASILGVVGVLLRIAVAMNPSLEVGGGLPIGVTALYVVLGALLALTNSVAFLQLRPRRGEPASP